MRRINTIFEKKKPGIRVTKKQYSLLYSTQKVTLQKLYCFNLEFFCGTEYSTFDF